MHLRAIRVLGVAFGLFASWMGCSGDQTGSSGDSKAPSGVRKLGLVLEGETCAHNEDCESRFCNRGTCVDPGNLLGLPCPPPAPDANPIDKLPEHRCGPYICLDGWCQSCKADAECQSYFGTGKCITKPETGWRHSICELNTTRRLYGAACEQDAQCQNLFCDRGTCAYFAYRGTHNYSETCVPGPPTAPPDDLKVAPSGGLCEGYLCLDGRCRSCTSDAECQSGGARDLRCLPFADWLGNVCVTPDQAKLHPPVIVNTSRAPSVP